MCSRIRQRTISSKMDLWMHLYFLLGMGLNGMTVNVAGEEIPAGTVKTSSYEWRVTVGRRAPDCFERDVILVNEELMPTLEVQQGEYVEITVINDIPESYPTTSEGISIHWHGFRMRNAQWYDGAAYVNQCPIQYGERWTYKFVVDEMPGTYFWHSHNALLIADGLTGPLIVRPKNESRVFNPLPYDEEAVLFIVSWYHALGAEMGVKLNRPFVPVADPNITGNFVWVGNPQSVLINGKGVYQDCKAPNTTLGTNASCIFTNPAPSKECGHSEILVEKGKTYLFRIINSGSLLYHTLCFEGHNVTVVAADAMPIQPFSVECVDINIGQRYDVILTANQSEGVYWVTAFSQYRVGAPNGYAVLKYVENSAGSKYDVVGSSSNISPIPNTPVPQPGFQKPWNMEELSQIVMNQEILDQSNSVVSGEKVYEVARMSVPEPNVWLWINVSQPVLNETGQIRWSLNNIVHTTNPPCNDLQTLMTTDPSWIPDNAVSLPSPFDESLAQQYGNGSETAVYVASLEFASPASIPTDPAAATHIAPVQLGDVVEVIIQNNPANSFNGGGGANRTAQEQHPFHIHGHHFWYLGSINGSFDSKNTSTIETLLNTKNPPLRDTITLYPEHFAVVRFVANNPGTWLMHCHIIWHEVMGQAIVIAEGTSEIPPAPSDMPVCPSVCEYSNGPWNITYTNQVFAPYYVDDNTSKGNSSEPEQQQDPDATGSSSCSSSVFYALGVVFLCMLLQLY